MNMERLAVIWLFVLCSLSYEVFAAPALKIQATIKSNRTNIYEGDTEELALKKGKVVQVLIGAGDDSTGTVAVEATQCRDGKFYQLSKRKIAKDGSSLGKLVPLERTSCQVGLAFLSYDLSVEDICAPGESIEFSLKEEGSSKPSTVLGSVFPKVTISDWESYLFIYEQFKYDPQQAEQKYVGVTHVFLSLSTAFAKVLNGQKAFVDYSINKKGVLSNYHSEFELEDGTHSLDLTMHEHGLDVGDTVTLKYSIAGFKHTKVFTVMKDYTQRVSLADKRVVYSLVVNDLDWYIAEPLNSVFKGLDYNRGGRHIDISHLVATPLGGRTYGNYDLHMTLNGYKNLYLNTSVVK